MNVELKKSDMLKPWDIIEVHFKYQGFSWWQAAQIAIFEERLKRNPQYELLRYSYLDNDIVAQLRITDKIPNPDRGITFSEMSLWLIGLPLLGGIALGKTYKVVADAVVATVDTVVTAVKTIWNFRVLVLVGIGLVAYMYLARDCPGRICNK